MTHRRRRVLHVTIAGALALLTVTGVAAAGVILTARQANVPTVIHQIGSVPVRPSSDGPIKVAIALGASGTVISDALAPYEVFASSSQFSVYTVAASKDPAPTQGGPAIAPAYTFTDTTTGRAPHSDVVVVPAVGQPDGPAEAALRDWVKAEADHGALVLGVCNGAAVLAAADLLEGRTATAHWSRLAAMRKQHLGVHWVAGQRFVQDGPITTTAGVTSGIPGALHVMAGLVGPAEANRVGRAVHYPNWSLNAPTTIPTRSFTVEDLPVALNLLLPWGRSTVGIAMPERVGEIDLASSFEVFDVSYAARPIALSATGTVTTKHGLVLKTNTLSDQPTPTKLAVPGSGGTSDLDPALQAWANAQHLRVDAVHGPDSSPGFDGALEYVSAQYGPATAESTAKMIDYPTTNVHLTGHGSARIPMLLLLGAVLVVASAAAPTVVRRTRRTGLA